MGGSIVDAMGRPRAVECTCGVVNFVIRAEGIAGLFELTPIKTRDRSMHCVVFWRGRYNHELSVVGQLVCGPSGQWPTSGNRPTANGDSGVERGGGSWKGVRDIEFRAVWDGREAGNGDWAGEGDASRSGEG